MQWRVAGPSTVPEFSAACFYFARELQKTVNVPMGLIAAAWGGSRIQTWMSDAALRAAGGNNDGARCAGAVRASNRWQRIARWGAMWEAWWRSRTHAIAATRRLGRSSQSGEWRKAPLELGPWEQWGVPELASYNGMVWYRTNVTLTAQQAQQPATLSLGSVDEMDQTWINGRPIGAVPGKTPTDSAPVIEPGPERNYRLPRGTLRPARTSIVVNVLDTYATGGLIGPAEQRAIRLADGTSVPLDSEWQYQIPPADIDDAAASTVGSGARLERAIQRHDRAARRTLDPRRRLVSGRIEHRRQSAALPGPADAFHGRLARAIRRADCRS